MKRNIVPTRVVLVVFAMAFASMVPSVYAQQCSFARAAGTYGFSTGGTVIGVGPRVSAGIFTLDAAGNLLNGKATSSLNGNIADEEFSGTYAVNSNCAGAGTVEIHDLSGHLLLTVTANFAWDDNMGQLRLIFTSAVLSDGTSLATVINGDARKLVP